MDKAPVYRIPLGLNIIPEGIHKAIIKSYKYYPSKNDKPDVISIELESDTFVVRVPLSLSPNLTWKIIDLFKSAGLYEKCIVDNTYLETNWDLLIGKTVYFMADSRGLKKFIVKEVYEDTKKNTD